VLDTDWGNLDVVVEHTISETEYSLLGTSLKKWCAFAEKLQSVGMIIGIQMEYSGALPYTDLPAGIVAMSGTFVKTYNVKEKTYTFTWSSK
jgi:hypothetical protein